MSGGAEVCVVVSLIDRLVLARSAFHNSIDYRAIVIYGKPELVPDDDREAVLKLLVEHIAPGRWGELRPVTTQELKATTVLQLPLNEASAMSRRI